MDLSLTPPWSAHELSSLVTKMVRLLALVLILGACHEQFVFVQSHIHFI